MNAAVRQRRPAPRLDGAAHLQRQLVEAQLPLARGDPSFAREPPQVAVGADVVEAMVVDAHVREVRRHAFHGARAPQLEEGLVAGRVELEQRRPELEALGPFGPPARLIAPLHGEHRCAMLGPPGLFDGSNLSGREREQTLDFR